MASVFLSYDREDAARARSVAQALEKAGHSVWWDRHIAGGAQYDTEIEEALKRSDAVVVLWSATAVRSAWVRDEAAAGRDTGKLIPARLDSADPPMGFRQYQTIDLTRWKGSRSAESFHELNRAVDNLGTNPTGPRATVKVVSSVRSWPARTVLSLATVLVILVAGIWWFARSVGSSEPPIVAVTAADNSAPSQQLARDLYIKLGRLQAATPDALEILDSSYRRKPDFTVQVSATPGTVQAAANIALVGRDRSLLWSKDFERPPKEYSDLKQQLAQTAAEVLRCASQAVKDKRSNLDQRTLKLYLSGCANIGLAWTDFRSLVPTFREVTRRAPDFEDGWGKLIETEAYVIGWETLPATSPEAQTLRADIAAARKINPRIAEAYSAEYILLGPGDIAGSAELLERATRDNPDDPLIQSMNAEFLTRVGRMNEAVVGIKRLKDLDPLSSDPGYIIALTYAGHLDTALKEIEKAERLWPGTHSLIEAKFRFHARYGDPKEALRIVRSGVNPGYARFESFLLARIDPTKENVDRAVAEAKARIDQSPRGYGWLYLALAQFGREDEIYSILEKRRGKPLFAQELFFRPEFHRFRHDVRFMTLMKRQGLVDYWRKSGKWPDFCFEPDLPYDCKVEAAKLG